ncbi:MAG: hypothetical protein SFY66_23230 [Oculatellaceae cyanobacterium bins.114]|nr:hypothetical protein [Oculatellaceae cyanobacterium bins.114]
MTFKKVLRQFTLRPILQWLNRPHESDRHLKRRFPQSGNRFVTPVLALVLIVWCVALGTGLAQATEPNPIESSRATPATLVAQAASSNPVGTVDVVPPAYQLGQDLYLENCASCHVGLPPQIFPTDTWRNLLQDASHYGVEINPLRAPALLLVWNYVRTFSRPSLPGEQLPFRIEDSRYFKALHPRVELPDRIQIDSCTSCHPSALQFNFRQLTSEWENAP